MHNLLNVDSVSGAVCRRYIQWL